ncbi:MAG: OmpA family protein [Bacteroidota bacterium]
MKYAYLLLFLCSTAYGQIAADCKDAICLKLSRDSTSFLSKGIPKGYGELQEITAPRKDPYFFQQEHHTSWYKFRSPFTGTISLEILPLDVRSDYDFILFKDTTGNFCERLIPERPRPLRSVISRNDPNLDSKTGLSIDSLKTHIKEGPGSSFAKSIAVKKGERYYLVLDNVYGGGHGHRIDFFYYYPAKLFGDLSEFGIEKPLEGTVSLLEKETGELIDSVKLLDTDQGRFKLNPLLEYGKRDMVKIESPTYFAEEIPYKRSKKAIKIELLPSKKGAKVQFQTINFYGNSARFLPRSDDALALLRRTMEKHEQLQIQINGHVNAAGIMRSATKEDLQRYQNLSQQRADAVKRYLSEHGIAGERIKTQGFGASQMLFPHTMDEFEMMKNRRVEIKILDF